MLQGGNEHGGSLLHTKRKDLCTDPKAGETALNCHQVSCLLDRFDDCLDVKRLDRPKIDDFGFDSIVFLELFGRRQ